MRYWILTLAFFLFASPALATNDIWVTSPTGTLGCRLPKDEVCYLDTAASGATPILKTVGCREMTATLVSDISDDSLSANTAGVYRFFGTGDTADANDDEAILVENTTLDGDPATSTDTIYGFDGPSVYFRVTNSSGTSRAIVQCWQG